jgi:anti-sigma factor RsiW
MSLTINIENYESFYLDYLEGTLSAEAVIAFERFLAEHPELAIDPDLFALDAEDITMDSFEKELLKKGSEKIIGHENIEVVLIAAIENQLSANESLALSQFIHEHPEYSNTLKAYQLTKLEADQTSTIDKSGLYQKERALVFAPWVYRSAAAAAVLLIAFLSFKSYLITETALPASTQHASKGKTTPKEQKIDQPSIQYGIADNAVTTHQSSSGNNVVVNTSAKNRANGKNDKKPVENTSSPKEDNHNAYTPNHTPTILPDLKEQKVVAITKIESENKANNQDVALANKTNDALTPMEYLKSKVVEKLNAPVEIKSTKSTDNEKNGFFVRIGKLEISHKKGKK